MQPQKQTNTNIGVGIGVFLQLAALVLLKRTEVTAAVIGLVLILCSIPPFIWGCMNYAEGQGHSKWVGLVGLAGIIGLIVLIVLPNQERGHGLDTRGETHQFARLIWLITMLAGFGLAVLGRWLWDMAEDARLERMLGPWPAVCILLGAGLVVSSLFGFLVDKGRC
jgi:uncharacterized membrane protein YidH (DUF202 family)